MLALLENISKRKYPIHVVATENVASKGDRVI
jgi:hypothetical protein